MNFATSVQVYNRDILKRIAGKTLTFEELEDKFAALENYFQKDILEYLTKFGFPALIQARQATLSDHFQNIDDFDLSIKNNYLQISMNNGEIIRAKPGSLRRIIINEFNIKETHPAFLLLMGYVYVNCLDSFCICRAIEAHLDEEL